LVLLLQIREEREGEGENPPGKGERKASLKYYDKKEDLSLSQGKGRKIGLGPNPQGKAIHPQYSEKKEKGGEDYEGGEIWNTHDMRGISNEVKRAWLFHEKGAGNGDTS